MVYSQWNENVPRAMALVDHAAVNVDLIVQLIGWLAHVQGPDDCSARIRQQTPADEPEPTTRSRGRHTAHEAQAVGMNGGMNGMNGGMHGMNGGMGGVGGMNGGMNGGMLPGMPPQPPTEPLFGAEGYGEAQAVLVFLQGIKEIQAVQDALLTTREYMHEPARSWVLPIHSGVPPEEQRMAFVRPVLGCDGAAPTRGPYQLEAWLDLTGGPPDWPGLAWSGLAWSLLPT